MSVLSRLRRQLFSADVNDEICLIRQYYRLELTRKKAPILIISCLDSRISSVGFADRLRGMVSCYAYAKAINVPFRIEHVAPFDLSEYLVPNLYDWTLKSGEKDYNLLYSDPIVFMQHTIEQHSLKLFRLSKNRQHHLYTNASYLKDINSRYHTNYSFLELYQELFKPSSFLEDLLETHLKQLHSCGGYISISFRFMQLMGDFKDCGGETLSEGDKLDLLQRSLSIVNGLYEKHQKTVFVTSDSQTFLNEASKLANVYIAPGTIGHIGFSQERGIYDKMFTDFYLISQADHVYMAHSGKMYRSNFAKMAASTSGAQYDEIAY